GDYGRAIAKAALRAGYAVVLEDFSVGALEKAKTAVENSLDHTALANLRMCTGVDQAIREADLIIETTPDELETKLELFTIFDKFAKPGAIFATTSTQHLVSDLAEITACPERCVALQFSPSQNPTALQILGGPHTSPATVESCSCFGRRLGIHVG